jgi:hypothetical protein
MIKKSNELNTQKGYIIIFYWKEKFNVKNHLLSMTNISCKVYSNIYTLQTYLKWKNNLFIENNFLFFSIRI